MDQAGLADTERGQVLTLSCSDLGALSDAPIRGLESDQVHAVELLANVAPGVAGVVLGDPDQQQAEPAQLDVGAEPVLPVVEHRPQPQRAFQIPPAVLDLGELFVGGGQIGCGEGVVGGADNPFAVEAGIGGDRGLIDAQQPFAAGGAGVIVPSL